MTLKLENYLNLVNQVSYYKLRKDKSFNLKFIRWIKLLQKSIKLLSWVCILGIYQRGSRKQLMTHVNKTKLIIFFLYKYVHLSEYLLYGILLRLLKVIKRLWLRAREYISSSFFVDLQNHIQWLNLKWKGMYFLLRVGIISKVEY